MISKFRAFLYSKFGEKTGEDIISKTISTAFVAIGGFIITWLYPILIAYIYLLYKVTFEIINTPRNEWKDLIWQIILVIIFGLIIAFAILFKLHSKLSSKLTTVAKEIKDDIEPIKTKIITIESEIEQINNSLNSKNELKAEYDFLILDKSFTHIMHSKEKITHQRKYKIKAIYQDLKFWEGRFFWTGDKFKVNNNNKNYDFIPAGLKLIGTQEYEYYVIVFTKPIAQNEERVVELVWELDNSSNSAKNRFSSVINEPTQSLSMKISFAKELNIKIAICEISRPTPPYLVDSITVDIDATGMYEWKVNTPIFGYSYTIRWND